MSENQINGNKNKSQKCLIYWKKIEIFRGNFMVYKNSIFWRWKK